MKIAVYHNLFKGGALVELEEILKILIKTGNTVDIFTLNNNLNIKGIHKKTIVEPSKTKNIFQHLFQAIREIPSINRQFAKQINSNNYDLVLIFPCIICQSPPIIKYIENKSKCIYFFAESKREFYEKTSFDHNKLNRIIGRIIRLPIKWADVVNCKSAKIIVTNSVYSSFVLSKIYNKKSFVIMPGLLQIPMKKNVIKNNKKIMTAGLLSKLKGYDFSINQAKGLFHTINSFGRTTNEFQQIKKIASENNVKLNFIQNMADVNKKKMYKNNSIYLANQKKEPFGIITLEATDLNLFVLGLNQGGTPEIIQHGLNGVLYPEKILTARTVLQIIKKQDKINLYTTSKISWIETVDKLLAVLQRTPNE